MCERPMGAVLKRRIWLVCVLGVLGACSKPKADPPQALPQPPVVKLEGVVDASGERRTVLISPDNEQGQVVSVRGPSGVVVKTLKRHFSKETTFRDLQVLTSGKGRWVFFQTRDATPWKVDYYWDVGTDELYYSTQRLTKYERILSTNIPKNSPIEALISERERKEQADIESSLASCVKSAKKPAGTRKETPGDGHETQDEAWEILNGNLLTADGRDVLVGIVRWESPRRPIRLAVCEASASGPPRLLNLVEVRDECLIHGRARHLWFEDVAPPKGSELLVELSSIACTGNSGELVKLALYTSPLNPSQAHQALLEDTLSSHFGHKYDENDVEVEIGTREHTSFEFRGRASDYLLVATTVVENFDGSVDAPKRTERGTVYNWSEKQGEFVSAAAE